jgi:hypothetical protein
MRAPLAALFSIRTPKSAMFCMVVLRIVMRPLGALVLMPSTQIPQPGSDFVVTPTPPKMIQFVLFSLSLTDTEGAMSDRGKVAL